MGTVLKILIVVSFILLITGTFKPEWALFWSKRHRTINKSCTVYGIAFILLFVTHVSFVKPEPIKSSFDLPEQNTERTYEATLTDTDAVLEKMVNDDDHFIYVITKYEGERENKMDLYYTNPKYPRIDALKLRMLCDLKKLRFNGSQFYFLVLFDKEENAKFPLSPFTAYYGIEEDMQKHILVIFTYNKTNGFSEINGYVPNMFEGSPIPY